MNSNTYSHSAAGFAPTHGRSKGNLAGFLQTVSIWSLRSRQRRKLAQMDAHMLNDIGVSRGDAASEASKPFWQA